MKWMQNKKLLDFSVCDVAGASVHGIAIAMHIGNYANNSPLNECKYT